MNKNDLEDKEQSGRSKEDDLDIAQLFVLIGKGFNKHF